MRPLTLRLPAARLLVACVLAALTTLTAVTPAMATTSTTGVCHRTAAGHYTWERVTSTTAATHRGHAGDLIGAHVDAADCPGATITPAPVRYERATSPTGFSSWYTSFRLSFSSAWYAGR